MVSFTYGFTEGSCSRTLPLKSMVNTSAGVMVAKEGPKRFTSMRFSPVVMLRCPALPTLSPKRYSRRAAQQRSNLNPFTSMVPSSISLITSLLQDTSPDACNLHAHLVKYLRREVMREMLEGTMDVNGLRFD